MNKKTLKVIIMTLVGLFILVALNTVSKAASFDAKISNTSPKVGETFTVTVSANNAAGMYSVSNNNSNVSKVSGDTSEFLENGSATITYKAEKEGTTTITAKATDMTDLDDDTKKVTGSKTFTVTIKSNASSSNNSSSSSNKGSSNSSGTSSGSSSSTETKKGTISSCKINGITVKKDLKVTNKDSVPVVVNTSTKEGATIYNSLTKKSYKVKSGVSTQVQLAEGTNTLTITLDTGYKETRKIYSQKEEEVKPNTIEEEPKEKIKPLLKSLTIKEFTITPEFSSEVYEYSVIIPEEQNDITKLDIEAIANSEDFTVEITGNENLIEGDNAIVIFVKSKDGKNVATYKIKVSKEAKTVETIATAVEEIPQQVEEIKDNSIARLLIILFTSIIAIAGVVFAVIEYRYGSNKDSENSTKMPFASIGFEKEEPEKEDILEEFRDDDDKKESNEKQNSEKEEKFAVVQEEEKTRRKGKHF